MTARVNGSVCDGCGCASDQSRRRALQTQTGRVSSRVAVALSLPVSLSRCNLCLSAAPQAGASLAHSSHAVASSLCFCPIVAVSLCLCLETLSLASNAAALGLSFRCLFSLCVYDCLCRRNCNPQQKAQDVLALCVCIGHCLSPILSRVPLCPSLSNTHVEKTERRNLRLSLCLYLCRALSLFSLCLSLSRLEK